MYKARQLAVIALVLLWPHTIESDGQTTKLAAARNTCRRCCVQQFRAAALSLAIPQFRFSSVSLKPMKPEKSKPLPVAYVHCVSRVVILRGREASIKGSPKKESDHLIVKGCMRRWVSIKKN